MNTEKDFRLVMRMDRAIQERMDKSRRETVEIRKMHDTVKRTRDELARKLDK